MVLYAGNFYYLLFLYFTFITFIIILIFTKYFIEHDLAASTFATRITASTLSDFYSSVSTGIGTLRGSLHGGANEAAMHLLSQFTSVEEADKGVRDLFAKKGIVMGFGHRVYK